MSQHRLVSTGPGSANYRIYMPDTASFHPCPKPTLMPGTLGMGNLDLLEVRALG